MAPKGVERLQVEGRVIDTNGRLLEAIEIRLDLSAQGENVHGTSSMTNASGVFHAQVSLQPGGDSVNFDIECRYPSGQLAARRSYCCSSLSAHVCVGDILAVTGLVEVTGRIRDGSGVPFTSAFVADWEAGLVPVDAAGQFEVTAPVWPTGVRLRFGHYRDQSFSEEGMSLVPSEAQELAGLIDGVDLVIERPTHSIPVKVLDSERSPLANAELSIYAGASLATTGPDGVAIVHLTEKERSGYLAVRHRQAGGTEVPIKSILAGNPVVLSVRDSFSCTVQFSDGLPVAGAVVLVGSDVRAAGDLCTRTTDTEGVFRLEVGRERHQLHFNVTLPDGAKFEHPWDRSTADRSNETFQIELRAPRLREIKGRVMTSGGEPLGGVIIYSFPSEIEANSPAMGRSDASGFFAVAGCLGSETTLSLARRGFCSTQLAVPAGSEAESPIELSRAGLCKLQVTHSDLVVRPLFRAQLAIEKEGQVRPIGPPRRFFTDETVDIWSDRLHPGDRCLIKVRNLRTQREQIVAVELVSAHSPDVVQVAID
jgi:hypothetical protein